MNKEATLDSHQPLHPRLKRWEPTHLGSGSEKAVFVSEKSRAHGLAVKVNMDMLYKGYVRRDGVWLPTLDPEGSATLTTDDIANRLEDKAKRYARLQEFFGEHVPNQTEHFWKIPVDADWTRANLTDRGEKSRLPKFLEAARYAEYWSLVSRQSIAPELVDGRYVFSLHHVLQDTNPLAARPKGDPAGDIFTRALRHMKGSLVSPETKRFINGDSFGILYPEALSLFRASIRNPRLYQAVADFVQRAINYTNATGEIIDIQGKGNVNFFEASPGEYSYNLIDPFFPDSINGGAVGVQSVLDYVQGKKDLNMAEVVHAVSYTRLLNGLANYFDINDRVNLFPDSLKKKAGRALAADWRFRSPRRRKVNQNFEKLTLIEDMSSQSQLSGNATDILSSTDLVKAQAEAVKGLQELRERNTLSVEMSIATRADDNHPDKNEDFGKYSEEKRFGIVADGISTNPMVIVPEGEDTKGYESSRRAVESLFEGLYQAAEMRDPYLLAKIMNELLNEIAVAGIESGEPLETTLVVAQQVIDAHGDNFVVTASVGDSRAYLLNSGGRLEQLTVDHSPVKGFHPDRLEQLKMSRMLDGIQSLSDFDKTDFVYDKDVEYLYYQRNRLWQSMVRTPIVPNFGVWKVNHGDTVILTTDGIHDNLTYTQLEAIVRQDGDIAQNLIEGAYAISKQTRGDTNIRSKPDDMTALVMRFTSKKD